MGAILDWWCHLGLVDIILGWWYHIRVVGAILYQWHHLGVGVPSWISGATLDW